jgi:hypothetical protein
VESHWRFRRASFTRVELQVVVQERQQVRVELQVVVQERQQVWVELQVVVQERQQERLPA